jgi:23S rRNA pseudouridine1911/1915/1917 synthase
MNGQKRRELQKIFQRRKETGVGDRTDEFFFEQKEKQRLDVFLTAQLPELSRSRIQGLIRDGFVKIEMITITKPARKLEIGERIEVRIPPPSPTGLLAERITLDVIFENKNLVIINKPAGMVVHPSHGHEQGTLVNAALSLIPDLEGIGGEQRPGIVHRLDKDTSGLILIAKNERAHRWLQEQFRSRKVEKTYLALVDGKPPTPTGRVEAPIGRNIKNRKMMAVVPPDKGRIAISEFHTVETFKAHTLLEIRPLTGRTHQIRVHMAFLGCPITGDIVYGKQKRTVDLDRHFLHAYRLKIVFPDEEVERIFEAAIPKDLEAVLNYLRRM